MVHYRTILVSWVFFVVSSHRVPLWTDPSFDYSPHCWRSSTWPTACSWPPATSTASSIAVRQCKAAVTTVTMNTRHPTGDGHSNPLRRSTRPATTTTTAPFVTIWHRPPCRQQPCCCPVRQTLSGRSNRPHSAAMCRPLSPRISVVVLLP